MVETTSATEQIKKSVVKGAAEPTAKEPFVFKR